ncbi:MAG: hypothetical protein DRP09_17140 [Candidatus Thorarchaeota archaeon]|nr:MAG: hypothetical protein DRP09_17140 [Candidatus Thorarchaeota archaeon]
MALIDFTSIRQTIETYLGDNFTTVPIKYENVGAFEDVEEYIALRDKATFATSMGMAETQQHTGGVVLIDIFTARGIGTQRSRTIATEIANLIANQVVDVMNFGEASLHTGIELEGYFQQVLQVPYSVIIGGDDASC